MLLHSWSLCATNSKTPAGNYKLNLLYCSWFPSWTPTRWMNLRGFWTTNPFVHPWYQPWHLDDNQCAPLVVDQWGVMGLQVKVLQKKIQFQKRPVSRSCHSARFSDRRRSPAALREMTTLNPHLSECTEQGSNFVLYLSVICLFL
jgi:hypothetical protein